MGREFWISQAAHKCSRRRCYKRETEEARQRQKRRQCGHRGRDGSEAATGQGMLPGPEAWDGEQILPWGLRREHSPANTLILGQN